MSLDLDAMKCIYRHAIDHKAGDHEGAAWWAEDAAEIHAAVEAPHIATASAVISWWHHDWLVVGAPNAGASMMPTR